MKKLLLLILLLLSFTSWSQKQLKVLASNAWTAAYVIAAGFEDVDLLAPSDMLHPSEYELQINDFKRITEADLIVYGGYEVAMKQLEKMESVDKLKFMKIETGYNLLLMKQEILRISDKTHTSDIAKLNIENIDKTFQKAKISIINKGLAGKPVIVHFFQVQFAIEIGLNPVTVFGPSPLEAYEISNLVKKDAVMIIDNIHNPIAGPLAEIKKNIYKVELINFPGIKNTRTLEDVVNYNIKQIISEY